MHCLIIERGINYVRWSRLRRRFCVDCSPIYSPDYYRGFLAVIAGLRLSKNIKLKAVGGILTAFNHCLFAEILDLQGRPPLGNLRSIKKLYVDLCKQQLHERGYQKDRDQDIDGPEHLWLFLFRDFLLQTKGIRHLVDIEQYENSKQDKYGDHLTIPSLMTDFYMIHTITKKRQKR
jgi:hypothetical protein